MIVGAACASETDGSTSGSGGAGGGGGAAAGGAGAAAGGSGGSDATVNVFHAAAMSSLTVCIDGVAWGDVDAGTGTAIPIEAGSRTLGFTTTTCDNLDIVETVTAGDDLSGTNVTVYGDDSASFPLALQVNRFSPPAFGWQFRLLHTLRGVDELACELAQPLDGNTDLEQAAYGQEGVSTMGGFQGYLGFTGPGATLDVGVYDGTGTLLGAQPFSFVAERVYGLIVMGTAQSPMLMVCEERPDVGCDAFPL
ncbi:MAG: hypothetical protein AAGN82_13495 [Myxococcota bacterium]